MALHHHCGVESQPLRVAHENGCRLFALMDPIKGMEKMNNVEAFGNDLRDCDLSDTVLFSAPVTMVPSTMTAFPKGFFRNSFNKLIEQLGPLKVPDGQPLIDAYMFMMPIPAIGMVLGSTSPSHNRSYLSPPSPRQPDKKPMLDLASISELWEEMEQLVDEGLVRTLGTSNFTVHQMDALIANARIRPSFVSIENHPLNQMMEYKEYCQKNKLAVISAIPLATGTEWGVGGWGGLRVPRPTSAHHHHFRRDPRLKGVDPSHFDSASSLSALAHQPGLLGHTGC